MAQITCEITLDVAVNDREQLVTARQGDTKSRLLCVRLTDGGKPLQIEYGATVLLNASNGSEAYAFGGIVSEGAALFTLPDFALSEAGRVDCDVSVLGADGSRLTSAGFTLCVAETVCPTERIASGGGDLIAELLAQDTIQPLTPIREGKAMVVEPALNRKYALDLSAPDCISEGSWLPLSLRLPTPVSAEKENWILIYCHAPVSESAGAISVDWGKASACLFADGEIPYITMGDFDVVCTYSPAAQKWQIGVVQYAASGGAV